MVARRVAPDCTVRFGGRTYSVPFHLLGREVEVFGCAEEIEIHHQGARMATHRRYTEERIVIDARHYEGPASEDVLPPAPLGRMGAGWRSSPRSLRSNGRWISTRRWRRWRDERVEATSRPRRDQRAAAAARLGSRRRATRRAGHGSRQGFGLAPSLPPTSCSRPSSARARNGGSKPRCVSPAYRSSRRWATSTSASNPRWIEHGSTLATCAWIREAYTLLLQGPPGVGKTHLAVALVSRPWRTAFRSPSSASKSCCSR